MRGEARTYSPIPKFESREWMKRVFSAMAGFFHKSRFRRKGTPPLHPIDALFTLEWSLSNGMPLAEGLSPWERQPLNPDISSDSRFVNCAMALLLVGFGLTTSPNPQAARPPL